MAIACANVAALFMAGALGRARELQIRAALGASRVRLVRQLSIESLVLAAIGSTIGVSLAWLLRPALIGLLPAGTPRLGTIEIDGTVITFALAIGVLTTLASGVLPGLIAARNAATAGLRDGGRSGPSRRAAWLGSGLMAAQLALAVVLVTGTGLMLRTLLRLYDRDPGIDVERLLALDVVIPDFRSRGRAAAVSDIERMTERIGGAAGCYRRRRDPVAATRRARAIGQHPRRWPCVPAERSARHHHGERSRPATSPRRVSRSSAAAASPTPTAKDHRRWR